MDPEAMDRDKAALQGSQRYQALVRANAPRPKWARDLFRAFLVGGLIALVGQVVLDFFSAVEPTEGEAFSATLAAMILLGAVLTGLGVYDRLGEWGGMGAAVPITGFSNSIVAAAMEFRREGLLLGLGARIFIIAGPVIVFGIVAGFFAGLVTAAARGSFP